jgi:hypothetical protein
MQTGITKFITSPLCSASISKLGGELFEMAFRVATSRYWSGCIGTIRTCPSAPETAAFRKKMEKVSGKGGKGVRKRCQ